ncbi:MAG: PKD domain-containing protein [Acidobacteriota bacterium]|nr:PKD domain-containing protein [Acidobacteriota bacterium]
MKNNQKFVRIGQRVSVIFLAGLLIIISAQAQSISHLPTNPNVEENITFTYVSYTTSPKVYWSFGNGDFMESYTPVVYAYTQAGTYTVVASTQEFESVQTTVTVQERRRVEFSPSSPLAGASVNFQAVNFLGTQVRWDFGDGTIRIGSKLDTHTYSSPGLYTVRAVDFGGNSNHTFYAQVQVQMPATTITYTPAQPRIKENVTFQAVNFQSKTTIRWDFGDGTVQSAPPASITHAYQNPGTYLVRAYDDGGTTVTASVQIRVYGPPSIGYEPENPRTGELVTFQAHEFFSKTTIRWDFGDGTIQSGPPPTMTHVYRNPGTYLVRAYDDGGAALTASISLRVHLPASLSFDPEMPRAGKPVTFHAQGFISASIRWDFGDGTIQTAPTPSVTHTYQNAGQYFVQAYDGDRRTVTASISVRVHPPASLAFHPEDPRPDEPVTFRAINFFSTILIRWDFGDGTIVNDMQPPEIAHTYRNPGTYFVRAYDGGGSEETASLPVQILPARMIAVSPPQPRVGEPTILRAVNFISPRVLWDLGDGTLPFEAGHEIIHTFNREGPIRVAASDSRRGVIVETTVPLTVFPREGPRSLFKISFISLRFSDGKPYKVVPKNDLGLQAFAEIKYEGTGILIAQWLINGAPFRAVSQALSFAESITIDSGPIPGLPAFLPGLHEVTLAIFQPEVEFEIPAIRYFVTVDPASIKPPEIELSLSGARKLDGELLPADAGRIDAPAAEHLLLQGTVRNDDPADIAFALLRVHLEEELIDQKLLKDLKSGEQRSFESSVFNGSGTAKSVFLTLYDISSSPARILSIREIKIVPLDK